MTHLRKGPLRSSKGIRRTGRIKPKKRSASEYARIYHSPARVKFVKALPCVVPMCLGDFAPSDNAHIVGDGMGRKAGHDKIVPLCRRHHRALHEWGRLTFEPEYLLDLDECAANVERAWLAHTESDE